jgi:undecaprenyl-phosphate 4-deoxy-4-formamido-L-arabinose transferase
MENFNKTDSKPLVTIIAPVYNEIENLENFYTRLKAVSDSWDRAHEILFVDDGSLDGSLEFLRAIPETYSRVRVIQMARNFGQQNAVMAAVDHANGEIMVFIDVDLQVIPEDIPRLVEKMDEGYDIVAGYRPYRNETLFIRRLPSKLTNLFFRYVFRLPYKDIGCGLQAFRKKMMDGIDPYNTMYSHGLIVACWRGGKFADIPVQYNSRAAGETKYNFCKLLHFFLDMLITFQTHPYEMVIFFLLGSGLFGVGLIVFAVNVISRIIGSGLNLGWFGFSLLMLIGGLIFILYGFINERINRINHQINKTPLYVIEKIWEASSES